MRNNDFYQDAAAAEYKGSASCAMSAADFQTIKTITAIVIMMAVLLFSSVCHVLPIDILISIILLGIILVIVRGKDKPVSRT